ncbi:hypothetical protein HK105_207593 [Polyrhizophydium stewartii]|uniref:Autophagy-related protein n=1 Tax=Polyrhizophydium stewartii TaxID=2732419 RepID=A0ABR4N065_9FUNG
MSSIPRRDGSGSSSVSAPGSAIGSATAVTPPAPVRQEAPETTSAELRSFWLHNAALATSTGAGGLLSLLLLDDLARGAGVFEKSDTPCTATLPANVTAPACVLPIGGSYINTFNYIGFVVTVGLILEVLAILGLSAFGDHDTMRRWILLVSCVVGSLASIVTPAAYTPSLYWLGSLFIIIITIAQSCSTVMINAWFPLLVDNDPLVKYHNPTRGHIAKSESDAASTVDSVPGSAAMSATGASTTDTTKRPSSPVQQEITESGEIIQRIVLKTQTFDQRANRIQVFNNIFSFAAVFLILSIGGGIVQFSGSGFPAKDGVLCFTGIVWLGAGVYTGMKLDPRPGPKLPENTNSVLYPWRKTLNSVKKYAEIRNTFKFLLAYFFFGGAMNTLGYLSTLYLRDNLQLTNFEALTVANLIPVFSIIGSYSLSEIQRKTKATTLGLLIVCVILFMVIPIYAFAGAFNSTAGLVHSWEAYILSAWGGFLYGGATAFSRVIFSQLIPPGHESEFFGMFVFADHVSSWFCSVLIGFIAKGSGVRYGIIWLVLFFIAAVPLLWTLDIAQGAQDARLMTTGVHDDVIVMDTFDADDRSVSQAGFAGEDAFEHAAAESTVGSIAYPPPAATAASHAHAPDPATLARTSTAATSAATAGSSLDRRTTVASNATTRGTLGSSRASPVPASSAGSSAPRPVARSTVMASSLHASSVPPVHSSPSQATSAKGSRPSA